MIINVNKDNFESVVINSDVPVLVDFNATWCGPCRMQKPILEDLASDRSNYKIVAVDIDSEGELAEQYNVTSIPCLVVFKGGREVKRSIGLKQKSAIESMMEEL